MRISVGSSDFCSSDLRRFVKDAGRLCREARRARRRIGRPCPPAFEKGRMAVQRIERGGASPETVKTLPTQFSERGHVLLYRQDMRLEQYRLGRCRVKRPENEIGRAHV